ncbi:MAG: response regulator [Promethearchaeota archaeon]
MQKNQKYIGLYIDEETKNKWKQFARKEGYSSLSKFIRDVVNFYINSNIKISYIKNFSKIFENLKKPLTSIKGFSQLMLEYDSKFLNQDALRKIKEIFNSSIFLEEKINDIFSEIENENQQYDILIVDENDSSNLILYEWFKNKGLKVKILHNIPEGLIYLKNNTPKIVLMDVSLDENHISKLCQEIRVYLPKKSKIILISASPEKIVKKVVEKSDLDGYILKPFDFSKLESLLRTLSEEY